MIDFDEPTEYAIHFWFRATCKGTVSNYFVIDGPFKFKVNANNAVLTAQSVMVTSTLTGDISSANDKWLAVT